MSVFRHVDDTFVVSGTRLQPRLQRKQAHCKPWTHLATPKMAQDVNVLSTKRVTTRAIDHSSTWTEQFTVQRMCVHAEWSWSQHSATQHRSHFRVNLRRNAIKQSDASQTTTSLTTLVTENVFREQSREFVQWCVETVFFCWTSRGKVRHSYRVLDVRPCCSMLEVVNVPDRLLEQSLV